jgi:hypothetical protein
MSSRIEAETPPTILQVDTNHYWESNYWPAVGVKKANQLGLLPDQLAIAYMEEEAWMAVVRHDPGLSDSFAWWVELGEELDYETHVASRLANQ